MLKVAILINVILSKQVQIEYCNDTCQSRGVFDTDTATFSPNAEFALDAFTLVTVRAETVTTVAENLGAKEDLRIWLSPS
jgi:hypothetical protein